MGEVDSRDINGIKVIKDGDTGYQIFALQTQNKIVFHYDKITFFRYFVL